MDSENDNIAHRDELLARFRESLAKPMSERYMDIGDLLDVFDYAGDMGDDYLRMEALMVAARYYPDNEDLLERKAIFYSQYSDDTCDKYIEDNDSAPGMIWDIMRARQMMPASSEMRCRVLDDIAEAYDNYTDEEVVQLIDLVSRYGEMQWLKSHMPMLRQKVEYLNMLLYEVAIAADNNSDVHMSVQMLEELTELEPYNVYFWMLLAKAYAALDEPERAMTSIEYALAINPDDVQSLLLKAKLLYVRDQTDPALPELLGRVMQLQPDSIEALRVLSSVYYSMGRKDMAAQVLNDYLKTHPEDTGELVPDLILFRPDDTDVLLDRFYRSNQDNSQLVWTSWARQLAQSGYPDVGEAVLRAYYRNSGTRIYVTFPIEAAFTEQRFDHVMELLGDYLEHNDPGDTDKIDLPGLLLMHLTAMLKTGETERALEFCHFLISESDIRRFDSVPQRLAYQGLMNVVLKVREQLVAGRTDWQDFDPLCLWNNDE